MIIRRWRVIWGENIVARRFTYTRAQRYAHNHSGTVQHWDGQAWTSVWSD